MKNKYFNLFRDRLKSVILLLMPCLLGISSSRLEAVQVSQQDLQEVLPGAEVFVRRQTPCPYYQAYKSSQTGNTLVGLCFLTTDLFPDEKGYNGPITIVMARDIARRVGLEYVYIGNVPGHETEHTYCPKCSKLLVKRIGFFVAENNIEAGHCRFCNERIPEGW